MSQLQNIYNLQIPKAANGCSNQNVCRNARLVNYITYILICLYKNILHIFMYLYMLYNVPRSQKDPKSAKSCMQAFSNALWLMLGSSPRPCITWSVSNCPGLRQGDKGVSGSRIRQGPQGDVLLDDASDHRRGEWVARELVEELDHLLLRARGEEPRQVARNGRIRHRDEPDWHRDRGHCRSGGPREARQGRCLGCWFLHGLWSWPLARPWRLWGLVLRRR